MRFWVLILIIAAVSCSTLAPLPNIDINNPYLIEKCLPSGSVKIFRAVHIIDVTIHGRSSPFIGVIIVDVPGNRIRATLLSVEGLTLLDATSNNGDIIFYQAMKPFISRIFARGLFDDIRFMFLPKHGVLTGAAISADGSVTCRWTDHNNEFEKDISPSGKTVIREYSPTGNIVRWLTLYPPIIKGFYEHMHMESYIAGRYSLSLKLLRGEQLESTDGLFTR